MGFPPIFYLGLMDLQTMLAATLEGMGYELVDLERINRGHLLRVFIDKPGGVDIDDCVRVSNHLTRLFAVENVDYGRLEVSSPGLDRPLKKQADFLRFAGEMAHVSLRIPRENRRQFTGLLLGMEGDGVRLEVDGNQMVFRLAEIESARLKPEF
jgi:ribosome maturation factor RimP